MNRSDLNRVLEAIRSAVRELETMEEEDYGFISQAVEPLRHAEYLIQKDLHSE